MRAGCIDIGSNTTRLLVADLVAGRVEEVHQEREFTRIGRELAASGAIGESKVREVIAVVKSQMAIASDHGAVEIRGVATAAIRSADNGDQLIDALRRATGLTVRIVSGREEARLAFVGAAAMLEGELAGELGVIDVGGGSSELVIGTIPDQIRWWVSVALGSGALADRCLASDPPSALELMNARSEVAAALAGLDPPCPALAVAVGGSATSLWRLAGPVLDAPALARALGILASGSASEIAHRYMIDPQRARLLPAGLLILEGLSTLLGVGLRVGRGGIREGVLLEARWT